MKQRKRTYTELNKLETFEERFRYLQLDSPVGEKTFGLNRYMNQRFYKTFPEWKRIRREVIIRDLGCDLGLPGHEILDKIIIHHMNPITADDIRFMTDALLNPEYLICTKMSTHNAIHYGDDTILRTNIVVERKPNDTCPWKN